MHTLPTRVPGLPMASFHGLSARRLASEARFILGCLSPWLAAPLLLAATEAPPVLRASDLLPPELRSGPGFVVEEEVPTDGFHGRFTIRSPYGNLETRGGEMLRIRAGEMAALQALASVTRVEALTEGIRSNVGDARGAARHVVQDPVSTVAQVPQGVAQLFSRVGQKVGSVGHAAGGKAAPENPEAVAASHGANEGRRAWAKKLGVDPYTTNPLLARRLDELARASRVGSLAVGVATGGATTLTALGAKVLNDVCDLSPAALKAKNEARLAALGIDRTASHGFFTNGCWTPTTQTALVEILESLKEVGGRADGVTLAGQVRSFDEAHYLVSTLRFYAALHGRTTPLQRLAALGRLPVAFTRDQHLVVAGSIDYLANIKVVAQFARRNDLPRGPRDLYLTGPISPLARDEFTRAGWTVHAPFVP